MFSSQLSLLVEFAMLLFYTYRGTYQGQDVAVKRMPFECLKAHDKELLKSIKHENLVKILTIVSSFLCVPVNYN